MFTLAPFSVPQIYSKHISSSSGNRERLVRWAIKVNDDDDGAASSGDIIILTAARELLELKLPQSN